MIHGGSVSTDGDADHKLADLQNITKNMASSNRKYYSILAKRSGLSIETVEAMCQNDYYMTPTQAIRTGFADGFV
jgi:ATP-dependent protease ClpP protease subunit